MHLHGAGTGYQGPTAADLVDMHNGRIMTAIERFVYSSWGVDLGLYADMFFTIAIKCLPYAILAVILRKVFESVLYEVKGL